MLNLYFRLLWNKLKYPAALTSLAQTRSKGQKAIAIQASGICLTNLVY